jgi:hypothetical protein
MASNTVWYGGNHLADIEPEMDTINGYDNIVGYRVFITWGAIEQSQGNYDFSLVDAILNRLKTQYNKPKHLVLVVLPGPFGNTTVDGSVVPGYLQATSVYGASPVAGSYGWWGTYSGTPGRYGYTAALHRPAVMDRYIALVQALGAHYDSDPYFEALMFQEDAWMASLLGSAPDYNDAAFTTQIERLLSASTAAFPHTTIIMENTWMINGPDTQAMESWMVNNRIAPGSADTVGQTAFNMGYANTGLAWGLQTYFGITVGGGSSTGTDLRTRTHAMLDIEAPDIAGSYYSDYGAPQGYHPADVISALNQSYGASHAFWTHLFGSEDAMGGGTVSSVAPWAVWTNLAPAINSQPLTNTSYPNNYP